MNDDTHPLNEGRPTNLSGSPQFPRGCRSSQGQHNDETVVMALARTYVLLIMDERNDHRPVLVSANEEPIRINLKMCGR